MPHIPSLTHLDLVSFFSPTFPQYIYYCAQIFGTFLVFMLYAFACSKTVLSVYCFDIFFAESMVYFSEEFLFSSTISNKLQIICMKHTHCKERILCTSESDCCDICKYL